MKAIVVSRFGGPDVLEPIEIEMPVPAAGEALIEARAVAVNRPDMLMRNGAYPWMPPLPLVPGIDMAGTVSALGPGTDGFEVGDRVYLSSRELPLRGGCYAEFRAVPSNLLYKLPQGLELETAACLAAYQLADLLLDAGLPPVGEGGAVIVTGSSGAVGTALVQLARLRGAAVTAVARGAAGQVLVSALGAYRVLSHEDFLASDAAPGNLADAGFDALGGDSFAAVMRRLGLMGTGVFYGPLPALDGFDPRRSIEQSYLSCPAIRVFTMHGFDAHPARRRFHLSSLMERLAVAGLSPPVALRLPLGEAAAAHRAMEAGTAGGRILLLP